MVFGQNKLRRLKEVSDTPPRSWRGLNPGVFKWSRGDLNPAPLIPGGFPRRGSRVPVLQEDPELDLFRRPLWDQGGFFEPCQVPRLRAAAWICLGLSLRQPAPSQQPPRGKKSTQKWPEKRKKKGSFGDPRALQTFQSHRRVGTFLSLAPKGLWLSWSKKKLKIKN